jgi:CHAT domain-containing protein
MPEIRFRLDWCAGASAQVEIFCPKGSQTYQLKYTPSFRSTIRPPIEDTGLGAEVLDPINKRLEEIVATIDARATKTSPPTPALPDKALIETIQLLGQQLHDLVIPLYVQTDLSGEGLFLEIGMDENLLSYPWELMHDGSEFLCLKHAIGRFVNGSYFVPPRLRPKSFLGASLNRLSILLISVPNPEPRLEDNQMVDYDRLPEAEAETNAITDVLGGDKDITLATLIGKDATYDKVYDALKSGSYQIIHFIGHAKFDQKNAHASALVLQDRNIVTEAIKRYIAKSPPILCFVNACDTARTTAPGAWKDRYNIFGLSRAFLETGAYLLGSRWKVNDKAASEFAKKFYSSLLKDGRPLGMAILEARKECRALSPSSEFAWANYTLYGDPRVSFLAP